MSCPARSAAATVPCVDLEEERAHARDLERRLAARDRDDAFESGYQHGRRQYRRELVNAALVGLTIGALLAAIDALAASLFES